MLQPNAQVNSTSNHGACHVSKYQSKNKMCGQVASSLAIFLVIFLRCGGFCLWKFSVLPQFAATLHMISYATHFTSPPLEYAWPACHHLLTSNCIQNSHPKLASKTHIQNSCQKWRFVAELLPSTCPNIHSAFSRFPVHHSAVWAPVSAPSWVLKHNRGFNGALWKKHAKKSGKKMKLSQATLQVLHLCILSSNWLASAFCLGVCVCTYHKLTNLSKYPQLFRSKVLPQPFRASASCWAAFMDSWWLCINSASSMSPQDGQLGSCIGRECTIPNKKTRKITWNIWHE